MRVAILAVIGGMVLSGGAAPARARTEAPAPASAEESAEIVVRGEVVAAEGRRVEGSVRIVTAATLRIDAAWRRIGALPLPSPGDALELVLPGGHLDGITTVVAGVPRVAKGDEVVWVLRRAGDSWMLSPRGVAAWRVHRVVGAPPRVVPATAAAGDAGTNAPTLDVLEATLGAPAAAPPPPQEPP